MQEEWNLRVIARIKNDFTTKFGIPRQSGLAPGFAEIVFEPEYRDANSLRGLEEYSHIWLLWGFSEFPPREKWSPMVKPPRLGGKQRMGVFATRSPNRPNPIGLSSVKLEKIESRKGLGQVLVVSGADLMDGSPIYDIKPYLSFTDSHPEAKNGFAEEKYHHELHVEFPQELAEKIPEEKRAALLAALKQDPRPAYQEDPDFRYGFAYAGYDIRFRVKGEVLTVFDVVSADSAHVK